MLLASWGCADTAQHGDGSVVDAPSADGGGAVARADAGGLQGRDASNGLPGDGGRGNGDDAAAPARDGGGRSGSTGSCDPGTTDTAWATGCQTTPSAACVAGTWTDPGSSTNDPLQCESAHFAVHAPAGVIDAQQCMAATATLENTVWPSYFGSPMFMPEPYCQSAKKYKASIVVHSDSGLTGGGWGQGYMGMWIGPGATADHWGLAHEFMHAVQSLTHGLSCNDKNTCGWIYESHANYAAHQLPEYRTNVHCSELLVNAPHLYLGSTRDRYCNWQFMEFLKDKHCYQAVNDIWTSSKPSADPFTNIATTRGWTIDQLNDFFGEWAMHNVTWDYQNPAPAQGNQGATYRSSYGVVTDLSKPERRLRTARLDPLDAVQNRYVVAETQAPQRWGYNLVRLYPQAGASEVTVTFRGVVQKEANPDFRWGLVATDSGFSKPRYSALQRGTDGELTFCVTPDESLFLVVVATPSVQQTIVWDQLYPSIYRYPYMVELKGALPEGYQANAATPSATGKRWDNGGGWVATTAKVAAGAYVGPMAAVLSGTVGATARIEGHAVIAGATVNSGVVGGLSVLHPGLTVDGSAKVELAWPYGPSWFEKPQTVAGSAHFLGDLEYRGQNQSETAGTFCGFVDNTIKDNCSAPDVTVPAPYVWR